MGVGNISKNFHVSFSISGENEGRLDGDDLLFNAN